MALARVQTTPKFRTGSGVSIAHTFTTPPTVGHALIVPVILWRSGSNFVSCTDNRGNSYTLAHNQSNGSVSRVGIFYCPQVTVATAPFTVTVTVSVASSSIVACAIEVTGVGETGLLVDQVTGATATTAAPTTGATAAVTADEVFAVAAHVTEVAQASITVQAVSPAWTQEFEELSFSFIPGEANSRVLTGALGTTQHCAWTNATSAACASVIVAFKASALTASTARVSQVAVDVVASAKALIHSTQAPVEVVAPAPAPVRITQTPVELLVAETATLRLSQAIVEIVMPPVPEVPLFGTPGIAWIEWRGRAADLEALRGRPRPGRRVTPREDVLETVALSDWDLQDPPAYYHGFKAARVEAFGSATRTLSDPRTGAWQGSSCEIRLADPDRALRTALAASPQRFGADALVTVRMVSRPVRAVLGEPLTVFAGPIRRADPSPTLSVTLLLEDAIGHNMLTDELLIPQRQVEAATLPATLVLAEGAAGHPVPILYGTHARDTGAVAPVYLGIEGGTQHVWLVAGHYAAVTNVFLDGVSVLGTADWTVPGHSPGPLVEDYGGRRYTLLRGRAGQPPVPSDPVLYAENAGAAGAYFETWVTGLFSSGMLFPSDRWDPNATTGPHAGTRCLQGVDLHEGDAAIGHYGVTGPPGTAVPRGYDVNSYDALVLHLRNDTVGWGDANLQIRFTIFEPVEVAGIVITLTDGSYGLDTFASPDAYQTIEIPIADFEVEDGVRPDRIWIVKGGDDPLDVALDDISLTGGAAVEAEQTEPDRAAGGAPLTINVTGWTTTGDETGTVIEDLYAQYQHFLINYVATPAGYLTGGPLPNPTTDLYDRVVTVIDEASFTTAAAQAVMRLPPDGYRGRGVLGASASDRLPVREWIARWNLSADCRFGVSRYGELFVVLADPTPADRDDATLVEEVNDILEGTFSLVMGWEVQATRVPYRADYHWATATWLANGRDAEDAALADVYGKPAGIDSPVKDYWFVPTAAQGKNVAEHEVQRVGHPPRVLEFETGLQLATAGLGGYLRVRHFAGVGPSEERLVQIEELTVAPGTRRVRIRGVDVTALVIDEEGRDGD